MGTDFSIVAATILVVFAGAVLLYGARSWINRKSAQRRLEEELRVRATLVRDYAPLATGVETSQDASAQGLIPILAVGTAGIKIAARILRTIDRAGLQHMVGPILFADLDIRILNETLGEVPSVFRSRLTEVTSDFFRVGMTNMKIATALANQDQWLPDVKLAATTWLNNMREAPGLLLAFIGGGGSPVLGVAPLQMFRKRYELRADYLHCYGITIIDDKEPLRARFGAVRKLFMDPGLLRGMFVIDNRLNADRRFDEGLGLFLAGLLASSDVMDTPTSIFNVFPNFFSEPGSIATISLATETLQFYTRPGFEQLAPLHYVKPSHAVEQSVAAVRGLLMDPTLQALPVPVRPDRTRILLAIAPIVVGDMRLVGRDLRERTRWLLENNAHRNVILLPASIPANLQPDVDRTWLYGILAQRLAISDAELDAYAADELQPYPGFEPRSALLPTPLVSSPLTVNGTAKKAVHEL